MSLLLVTFLAALFSADTSASRGMMTEWGGRERGREGGKEGGRGGREGVREAGREGGGKGWGGEKCTCV